MAGVPAVQEVWSRLDRLQAAEPGQYRRLAESLAQAAAPPQPAICLRLVTKAGIPVWCNLLAWPAVTQPDYTLAQPSLPLAGGASSVSLGRTVYSVALHPSVLAGEAGEELGGEELANIVGLVARYLEQRHPGLALAPGYTRHTADSCLGELAAVRRALRPEGDPGDLRTASPGALLAQLAGGGGAEEGGRLLPEGPLPRARPLVQEVREGRKGGAGAGAFGANLQRAFRPMQEGSVEGTEGTIKIRNEETFLKEVQTRKLKA
jgi:hypothetical protein